MNVKPLLKEVNPSTFLSSYLKANGIEDVDKYLNPDDGCFQSPWDYPNMEEAVELLHSHILNGSNIGILQDCDQDGVLSAYILYDFIYNTLGYHNVRILYHTGKGHGIVKNKSEDIAKQVIEADIKLLCIPDAGSETPKGVKQLKEKDVDCLITDHHNVDKNNVGLIINPHLKEGLNTSLSGTGVTEKFIRGYADKCNIQAKDYTTEVALSLVSDSCSLVNLENRQYINQGLSKQGTEFIEYLFEKNVRKGRCAEGVSWGIAPLVNSICRSPDQDTKEMLFNAFLGNIEPSEALKITRKYHNAQTEAVKKALPVIDETVDNTHKFVLAYSKDEYSSYTGLIANKLMSKYNKPVILVREVNSTTWAGSIRSPEAVNFSTLITQSGFGECHGHEFAAGITVKKSQLNKLIKYLDDNLEDICLPVTASIKPKDITLELCEIIKDNKILWGKNVEQPTFYIRTRIAPPQVQVFTKRSTTIRITIDGIAFILFFAKDIDVEALSNVNGEVEFIVKVGVNEYMGDVSPQGIIEKYEICGKDENSENWEDIF